MCARHVYSGRFLCEFTVEFTAHQLHSQSASLTTHNGNDADVLGNDRGVKNVSLGAVIVHVPDKNLGERWEQANCVNCTIR